MLRFRQKVKQFSKTNTNKNNTLPKQKRMNSNISETTNKGICSDVRNKDTCLLQKTQDYNRFHKKKEAKIIIINKLVYLVGNKM